jgi:LPS export ABC transporter protein LptC
MNNRSKLFLVIILASALLIFSLLPSSPTVNTKLTTLPVVEADNYFSDVSIIRFNPHGLIESQLNANQLQYFQSRDTSLLTTPEITLKQYPELQSAPSSHTVELSQWTISSDSGKLTHAQQLLQLNTNVMIEQTPIAGKTQSTNNELTIKSAGLNLYLEQKKAKTSSKVSIIQADLITQAIGLEVDFAQQTFNLKQQVVTTGVENEARK